MNDYPWTRAMCPSDLPDVVSLAQDDPVLRRKGEGVESYIRCMAKSSDCFGIVYEQDYLIEGFCIDRFKDGRRSILHIVGRTAESLKRLLSHRLARLNQKYRFLDVKLELNPINIRVLQWAAKKGALIRSLGKSSGCVLVTFSLPALPRRRKQEREITRDAIR